MSSDQNPGLFRGFVGDENYPVMWWLSFQKEEIPEQIVSIPIGLHGTDRFTDPWMA